MHRRHRPRDLGALLGRRLRHRALPAPALAVATGRASSRGAPGLPQAESAGLLRTPLTDRACAAPHSPSPRPPVRSERPDSAPCKPFARSRASRSALFRRLMWSEKGCSASRQPPVRGRQPCSAAQTAPPSREIPISPRPVRRNRDLPSLGRPAVRGNRDFSSPYGALVRKNRDFPSPERRCGPPIGRRAESPLRDVMRHAREVPSVRSHWRKRPSLREKRPKRAPNRASTPFRSKATAHSKPFVPDHAPVAHRKAFAPRESHN